MKQILVTGAAGFMGSHLVDALVEQGHDVYGVDDLSGGYRHNVHPNSNFTQLDLRDKKATAEYVKQVSPHIIYHLAADATEGRSQFTPLECTERNYMAYLNVLVPAIEDGLDKVVLTSSMSVYGSQTPPFYEALARKPEDIYGISKAAMERSTEILSEVHGFDYTIIRPHNVYGERQNLADPYRNVIAIFMNCLLRNKNFYIYGDGEQRRAFSYIDDVTPCIAKAGFTADGEIINVGAGETITINGLAELIIREFAHNLNERHRPVYLPARPKEVKEAYCTIAKSESLLGYKTTVSLQEGIKRMAKWARAQSGQPLKYLPKLELTRGAVPETWAKELI